MKKYRRLIYFFAFLVLFIGIIFVYLKFQINKVIVNTDKKEITGLEKLNNSNLLFLNSEKLSSSILTDNQFIESVKVEKKYPDVLIISLISRIPTAQIQNIDEKLFIDKDGVLLKDDPQKDLPLIELQNMKVLDGGKADWRVIKANQAISNIQKQSILIERIVVDDKKNVFEITTKDGILMIVPYLSDLSDVATSLQVIVSRFRIEGKFIKKIDLRYTKPIIVLANE